mgnify:CR=1 FL=1
MTGENAMSRYLGRIAIVADPTGAMMGWMTPKNG